MNTIATDKGELLYEGELAVGTEVFVNGEEGLVPAADEDYVLEDGRTLEVAESKVAKITDAPAEEVTEEPTEEAMAEETPETPVESEEVAALKAEIERLQEEIKELKKENKELKAAPMATAAHDEFTTSVKAQKTGDKGLDRLSKIIGK
jgi:predicted RNase H-like nuclease (RuvC/YqgF family)